MGDFILGYLLNAAWEAPLIAVAALLLLRLARLDARERCWMGIGFLALSVTLPALDPRLMPSFTPPVLPEAVSYAVAPDLPAVPAVQTVPDVATQTPAPVVAAAATPSAQDKLTLPAFVGMGLLWAFLAAVVVGLARLGVGLIAAGRLIRRSRPIELAPAVLAPMRRLATAHGRRAVPVRISDSLTVPAVVGGWSPVILAPADFERHGHEAMTAALLHECAHVVRGDYAINLACEALTLPLIWHPAVHLIKSHIQADREAACDRLAAGQMPAKRYAACLVALADAMSPAPRTALAMQSLFGRGELERRVRMLLQTPMGEVRGRLLRAALVGGPVLGAVVTSGLIFHVEPAMAQAAQASQPAVSAPALAGAPPLSPQPPVVAATPTAAEDAAPIPPSPTRPKPHRMVERHVHRWTSDDGKTHLVIAEDEKDLTPEEQAKLEAEVTQAKAEAEKARAYTHSPEFHAMIVRSQQDESRADVAEARAEADAARAEGRAEANAAKAQASAEADEARAEARANGQEWRAQLHDMVERQRTLIANNRVEAAAQVQRVKEILHDPDVQKALRQARAAGPEVSRALDRLDRELDRSLDHIPAPPKPPKPPAPPEPPAPPPPPETE